jgi:transposase-like protein
MTAEQAPTRIDEPTIELIAVRVATHLREELEAMAADLAETRVSNRPLTVDDVAERFGVARSTVYAHWQEWGGYKLGDGQKAPIRFAPSELPARGPQESEEAVPKRLLQRRRAQPERSTIEGLPRLPTELGDEHVSVEPTTDDPQTVPSRGR